MQTIPALDEDWCMRLLAISDLHLDFKVNRDALADLPTMPGTGLITGGDLCTAEHHLRYTLDVLCSRFDKVFWVPGNHELWSSRKMNTEVRLQGEEKYLHLVAVCREYGVFTPEDPFQSWPMGDGREALVAPLFIPYDYSFRPDDVTLEDAIPWAMESGVLCSDEKLIKTHPFPSMIEWCHARYAATVKRLDALPPDRPLVLINHFPLRHDLVRLKRVPRFSIWCGTQLTEDFHRRYPTEVVISGHLHMRATDYRDGVRFEEVSLGYPRDWDQGKGMVYYLREILPSPPRPDDPNHGPHWRFF